MLRITKVCLSKLGLNKDSYLRQLNKVPSIPTMMAGKNYIFHISISKLIIKTLTHLTKPLTKRLRSGPSTKQGR